MTAKGVFDNVLTDYLYETSKDGIVANPGGGQANATPITTQTARVVTVATRGDSVKLPPSVPGLEIIVINDGANPMTVFPALGEQINGQGANVSILQMQQSIDVYSCAVAGRWHVEAGGGYSGPFLCELAEDNITANAGGGQAGARLLTSQTSRVATVATAGDSIKLPTSAPGLELMVINSGANPMQVFGSGTDTIDGVAFGTGVSQMPNSLVIYTCASSGAWYSEGLATGFGGPGLQTQSFANNLTATGTTQGTALALAAMINRVTTAAAGTGVALPVSAAGLMITVTNRGANPLTVYGAGADQVNGVGSVVMPPNSTALFVAAVAGQWECEGVGAGFSGNYPTVTTTNGITAAGTTQGTAVALTSVMNRVTTTALNTGVVLPASGAGMQIIVYNAGANPLSVYPAGTDTINGAAAGAAFSVAAGKNASFGAPAAGAWHAILSA